MELHALQGHALAASLTVNDLAKSAAWYVDVLGFAVDRNYEREGTLFAVSLAAGDAVRILLTKDDGAKGLDRAKGEGFSLRITTDENIDDVAARIKAAGGTLDSEPHPGEPRSARNRRVKKQPSPSPSVSLCLL